MLLLLRVPFFATVIVLAFRVSPLCGRTTAGSIASYRDERRAFDGNAFDVTTTTPPPYDWDVSTTVPPPPPPTTTTTTTDATTIGAHRPREPYENGGWIQKMSGRTRAKSLKQASRTAVAAENTAVAAENTAVAAENPAAGPVTLGRVLADVLYRIPWSVDRVRPECADDVRTYNEHVRNFTLWAAKMLDATSKGPEGFLDGNTFSFGNYDQCLSTKSNNFGIVGGYSLVDIDFRPKVSIYPGFYNNDHSKDYDLLDEDDSVWEAIKPKKIENFIQRHKFQWAVCLPDTCQSGDVQQIVSDTLIPELNRYGIESNVTIDPLLHTSNNNIYKYSTGFYVVCAAFVIGSMLIISGTIYDLIFLKYRPKSEHGPMKQIMKPFSLIANFERLMKPSKTNEFSVVNGIKVLAIFQVVIGHRMFLEMGNPQMNPDFLYSTIRNILFGHFTCTIFLDAFFVISGILTFHFITKILSEKKKLNFVPIVIYRWLRIFPVYGSLIVVYIFILPYLNNGPYWKMIVYRESERCQQNWWTNILFINNYVNTDELCIIPSWYLACDMHFFIIGTIISYAIWKWRRVGLISLWTILMFSTIIPAYVIMKYQHRGIVSLSPQSLHDLSRDRFFTNVYIKSHMRAMPYFMGMIAGYLYMKLKEIDYKLSLKSRVFLIPFALLMGNLIYMSSGLFFAEKHQYNIFEHIVYFTFGRILWSLIICYFIVGHALTGFGVFSEFLGHRVFQVLGKLVFCIYVYQEIIQLQMIGAIRTPTYQSFSLIVWRVCGDFFYSLLYSFAINFMIESPFDRLQKNMVKFLSGDKAFTKQNSKPHSSTEVIIENNTSK